LNPLFSSSFVTAMMNSDGEKLNNRLCGCTYSCTKNGWVSLMHMRVSMTMFSKLFKELSKNTLKWYRAA